MKRLHQISILLLILSLSACGTREKVAEDSSKPATQAEPTVHVPPPPEFYEGTPYWEIQSRKWPSLLEWTLGAGGEYTHDSLNIQLTGEVLQSFISGPKAKDHPVMCWFELTVRPVPKRLIGRSFNLDSVVFFDPIKQRSLPSLPMLSVERFTDKGVVRTMFSNNLAVAHSPDLQEDQQLVPTVFITSVEKKTIKITMDPLNISFLRELKPEPIPTDSLKWGPS